MSSAAAGGTETETKEDTTEEQAEKKTPPVKGSESVVGESQTLGFQAETRQLLDIVQHSLYSDREVFLRELVSNASDALEKARHAMLTSQSPEDGQTELGITITVDSKERMMAVADNGIGMSPEDLKDYLGTIARSGSKAFMQQLATETKDGTSKTDAFTSIIGKFGVGFYSVFMVADSVEVYTRKRGSPTGSCWVNAFSLPLSSSTKNAVSACAAYTLK